MAPPPGTLRVSRYFLALLAIFAVLYVIVFFPGQRHTPKLGIDLVGGIRVIFTAKPPAGQAITGTAMDQARQIIEDRINGQGVSGSTVQVQGDDQLVVSIPGGTETDVKQLGQAAQLNFRPVIAPAQQVTCDLTKKAVSGSSKAASATASAKPTSSGSATKPATSKPSPSGSAGGNARSERRLTAPSDSTSAKSTPKSGANSTPKSGAKSTPKSGAKTTPKSGATSPSPSSTKVAACTKDVAKTLAIADPKLKVLPTSEDEFTKLGQQQQQELAAGLQNFDCNSATDQKDNPKKAYIACEEPQKGVKLAYLLGSVVVKGTQVTEASAIAPSTGGQGGSQVWTVQVKLNDSGQDAWGKWTTAHNTAKQQTAGATQCGSGAQAGGTPCSDYVAFTLDGKVISAPATNEPITGEATQVTGNFTQSSANDLADQLKYGALPLTFNADSNERVSATLGTSQLKAAFLAGGIGLVLVVLYSLLYYRALGLITIASLAVSGGLTYGMLVMLATQIGLTLDLAGIAGFIVALGITADSFVVFFERIKDEVHEGRSARVAVPRAWVRARRTILSANTVSFLAAAILYYFASADVKGFAFTLGLSTILDVVVVFLFTHPIVSVFSRSRAFGKKWFTGLDTVRVGGITLDSEPVRRKSAKSSKPKRAATGGGATTLVKERTKTEDATEDATEDEELDVADDEDTATPDAAPAADTTEAEETDEVADVAEDDDTASEDDPDADDGSGAAEPRRARRTTPEPGTAAERAAARRARMREQREKGDD